MTDVKVMSVTFLLPAGRSRDRDRFSHGSDVPYDYISQSTYESAGERKIQSTTSTSGRTILRQRHTT